jgi:hypothetical protein
VRAWWTYWLTVGIGAALWLTVILFAGRDGLYAMLHDPLGLTILLLPIAGAGVNLIAYRESHERVCRLEAERHRLLRALVGRGYSSETFAITGIAVLAVAAGVLIANLGSL